jgi:hypothetical protein
MHISKSTTKPGRLKSAVLTITLVTGGLWMSASPAAAQILPLPAATVSTMPANGDVNPYGVAFVPQGMATGTLQPGDILVSNFNNANNLQGTGTTILRVDAHSNTSTFFQSAATGLTAALGITRAGYVFVGSLPTTDGTSNTIKPGSLLIVNSSGSLVGSIANTNLINGPWGMAVHDFGVGAQIFVSNVLAGNVVRLDVVFTPKGPVVVHTVVIAAGFTHRTDPAALVLGPSGLFYNAATDTLYVASSTDNAIYTVAHAGTTNSEGTVELFVQDLTHLHGPLDITMAPNGDLLVANSDGSNATPNLPSEVVEYTPAGTFVAQFSIDPNDGGAFGLAVMTSGRLARFATVDDNAVTLTVWTEPIP